ncbi:MAG: TonB-dependent receptor [Balneolaceae bacterium]|jgi:hypothetical protein
MKYRSVHIWLCILFVLIGQCSLYAQEQRDKQYSYDFRGKKLSSVLEEIATETGIDLVYDPQIVKGISIYKRIQNRTVPNVLNKVLKDTELDFVTLSSGTVVIVKKVNEAPAYGSFAGTVIDRNTGEPLPGATVMLANASGGTSTGPSGDFSLNHMLSGSYKIIFSYVGYNAVTKTIRIKPNRNVRQKVALKARPVDFTPIVVTDHLLQLPGGPGSKKSIDPHSPWEPAGKMRDAIRSLSLFSGVQYGLPMTDLHLQGGQRGEHRILLDGVPVYNPYSFGEMFSAFSPFAINKVELYKAGYDVTEGSQIAGLINLNHNVNSINRDQALIQGDPLSINLRGDLSVEGKGHSNLKVMAAARSNYWDIYKEPRLQQTLQNWDTLDPLITNLLINSDTNASLYNPSKHISDVRFYDVHLASTYQIDSYKTLNTSFYAGKNYVNTDLLRQAPESGNLPQFLYARDEYRWNNFMGQVTYHFLASSRLDLSTQISFSSNQLHHRYLIGTSYTPNIPDLGISADAAFANLQSAGDANLLPTQKNENSIRHVIISSDGSYSFNPHFNLEAGIQADHVESRVSLADLFYLPTLSDQHSTFFSTYLNGNWRFGTYWKLVAGNRLTFDNTSATFYAEPRASLQIDRPNSGLGYWSAHISGGLYRQFVNQYEITNPGPTSLVPSFTIWSHAGTSKKPKAWHLSGSFHLEPTSTTTLNLELFYKWQPITYTVSYQNLLQGTALNRSQFSAFAEMTKMRTFGTGFRLNQSLGSGIKLMASYDYSFNRINMESQFGKVLPAPWNEPHRFQLRALWHIVHNLTAVTKWQSIFGRKWGFRQSYYNYLYYQGNKTIGGYSFSHPEKDRLSPFHQLDLSLIYKPTLSLINLKVRLDLVNLLGRRNTIDWSLKPVQQGDTTQYKIQKRAMPGFTPSISLELQL